MATLLEPLSPDELTVSTSDILVATARTRDPLVDESVSTALRLLREMLKVDAVFVGERVQGRDAKRACGTVDGSPVEFADVIPLEQTYCRLALAGRLAASILEVEALASDARPDDHVMAPIVLKDGRVYGTLGCRSSGALAGDRERTLQNLRRSAKFVADSLDRATA